MTDEPNETGAAPQSPEPETPQPPPPPEFVIPRSWYIGTVAIVVGSIILTLFVRNPYTQAVMEGSDSYERSTDTNLMMWIAIFIGIPASFWAYKTWILPLFERK